MFDLTLLFSNNCITGDRRIETLNSYCDSPPYTSGNKTAILTILVNVLESMDEEAIRSYTKDDYMKLARVLGLLSIISSNKKSNELLKPTGNPILIFQNRTLPYSFVNDVYNTISIQPVKYLSAYHVCKIIQCIDEKEIVHDDPESHRTFWRFIYTLVNQSDVDQIRFYKYGFSHSSINEYMTVILRLLYKMLDASYVFDDNTQYNDNNNDKHDMKKQSLLILFATIYNWYVLRNSIKYEEVFTDETTTNRTPVCTMLTAANKAMFQVAY